jgi:hypothetical protein
MTAHPLSRFEIRVLKDRLPPTDLAQVPASATIQFFRQGATVSSAVTVPPLAEEDTVVNVVDAGSVSPQEIVAPITSLGNQLRVTQVISATQFTLFNPSQQPIMLQQGDRLVPSSLPTVYADPAGQAAIGSSILTDPGTGRASAYVVQTRFDFIVSIPGQPKRVYLDAQGLPTTVFRNAADFAGLQEALDLLPPEGGTVFLPAGQWRVPTGGLRVRKPVELYGERGTVLRPFNGSVNDEPVIVIDATGLPSGAEISMVSIHDLAIVNDTPLQARLPNSHGIETRSAATTKVTNLDISNVTIVGMGGDGIHIVGANGGAGAVVFARLRAIQSISNQGCGYVIKAATVVVCESCYANANGLHGYLIHEAGASPLGCGAENNCLSGVDADGFYSYSEQYGAQVRLKTAYPCVVMNPHIENFSTEGHYSRRGLILENSPGCQIIGGLFVNGAEAITGRAIWIMNGCAGAVVAGATFSGSYENVYVEDNEVRVSVFGLVEYNGKSRHAGIWIPWVRDENRATPSELGKGAVVWSETRSRLEVWTGVVWEGV